MSSQTLDNARRGNIDSNIVWNRKQFGSRDRSVFAVGSQDGVSDAITDLDTLSSSFVRNGSNDSTTLLSSNEWEVTWVETLSVVSVNEVDSSEFVLDNNLTRLELRGRKVELNFECMSITSLSDNSRLYKSKGSHKWEGMR
jgi:hypothetical protein